ncbi:MAG: caspase family protein [Alphaproteobacteria bacterium]|nr:caspase family protein [Alphaproteobacteria bacterium]
MLLHGSFGKAVAAIFILLAAISAASAQSRIALVIGNSAYQNARPLVTVAGDAMIVAETMRAAGYDVVEARDVLLNDIGPIIREFLDKVSAAGPEAVAYVYFAGYAAQSQGENFLVPVDARIDSDDDLQYQALRLNDLIREMMSIPAAARLVVLDAARDHGFGRGGPRPVAQGLALMDLPDGMLLASAAAPGALAIDGDGDGDGDGSYSIYTTALVTFKRQLGRDMEQIFKATRVQVNQLTSGRQTPWMASTLTVDLRLFDAPAAAAPPQQVAGIAIPPKGDRVLSKDGMRRLGPDQAYQVVIEEDGLEPYQWFVELYPEHPSAGQIWQIIDQRREAVLWRRTLAQGTRNAYWNYLKRYPSGEHAAEAENLVASLSAPRRPPVTYVPAPEPLPPDYYDEAVGLAEIYPTDNVSPIIEVFEALAPLFIAPPRFRDFGLGPIRRPPPPPQPPFRDPRIGQTTLNVKSNNQGNDNPNKNNHSGVKWTKSPTTSPSGTQTGVRRDPPLPPTGQPGRTPTTIPQSGQPGRTPTTTPIPSTPTPPQPGVRPGTPTATPTVPAVPPTGVRPATPTGARPGLPPTSAPTPNPSVARPAPPPTAAQKPGLPPAHAQPPSRPVAPPQKVAPPPRPAAPPPRPVARPAPPPPRAAPPPPRPVARPAPPPPRPAAPPPRLAPRPACPPGKRC